MFAEDFFGMSFKVATFVQLINNIMENLTDIFLKSRGHKYLRKVPNGKGGYRYIYEEPSLKTTSVVTREQKYKQNGWDYNTPSTVEYANDPQRKRLHRKTVAEYIKRSSRQGETSRAVFTLGGSGAGKSTVLRMLGEQDPSFNKIVTVDSDDIKTKTFKEDFDAYNKQEDGSAARRLHEESSELADKIVDGILSVDNDYLKDGTMKTYASAAAEIEKAKRKGYRTDVVGVTIPVEEAIRRATARAAHTGRKVEEPVIVKAHTGSTETFLKLIETGLADSLKLYDNSGTSPILIYDSEDENPIKDVKLFEEFKNKRNYTMAKKDNIEKAYTFIPGESDKEFKRMYQAASPEERKKFGFDLLNDADAEELEINRLANEWLRDGKPVD
jgi:predicted ABC-type ATPase